MYFFRKSIVFILFPVLFLWLGNQFVGNDTLNSEQEKRQNFDISKNIDQSKVLPRTVICEVIKFRNQSVEVETKLLKDSSYLVTRLFHSSPYRFEFLVRVIDASVFGSRIELLSSCAHPPTSLYVLS